MINNSRNLQSGKVRTHFGYRSKRIEKIENCRLYNFKLVYSSLLTWWFPGLSFRCRRRFRWRCRCRCRCRCCFWLRWKRVPLGFGRTFHLLRCMTSLRSPAPGRSGCPTRRRNCGCRDNIFYVTSVKVCKVDSGIVWRYRSFKKPFQTLKYILESSEAEPYDPKIYFRAGVAKHI